MNLDRQFRPSRAQVILCLLMVIGFAGAAFPAYFQIYPSVSLQSIWTVTTTVCLVIVLWNSRATIPVMPKVLLTMSVGFLLAQSTFALFTDESVRSYNYLFAAPIVVGGFTLGSYTDFGRSWRVILFWAANAACLLAPIFLLLGITGDSRVLQATLAFAVIIVSTHLFQKGTDYFAGLTSICIASAICFIDGARTASAVILLASAPLVLQLARQRRVWAPFLGGAQMALLLTSFVWNTRGEPVLNGDGGLSVFGLTVNTTGRASMAIANLQLATSNREGTWEALFGEGVGRSREISSAVAASDTPLNEFIRVFTDLGYVGISVLLAGFGFLAIMSIRLWRRGYQPKALESSLLLVGLVAFSSTENMLQYSWILLPIFVLLGSLNRLLLQARIH